MVDQFLARVLPVLERLNVTYEIVFVDDGSWDDTLLRLLEHRQANASIRIVAFSRRFGKEAATTAGLDHASAQAVVPIDCDLQDPPEVIEELLAKWRAGFDVVVATRRAREGETWMKRWTAAVFYRAFNLTAKPPIPPDTGDFRLMDRKVVQAIRRLPERSRFMKGLFAWVGFKQAAVVYDRQPRDRGCSKWNYGRLWNLAVQGITSFSSLPLRVWTYLGAIWISICILLGMIQAVHAFVPVVPAQRLRGPCCSPSRCWEFSLLRWVLSASTWHACWRKSRDGRSTSLANATGSAGDGPETLQVATSAWCRFPIHPTQPIAPTSACRHDHLLPLEIPNIRVQWFQGRLT